MIQKKKHTKYAQAFLYQKSSRATSVLIASQVRRLSMTPGRAKRAETRRTRQAPTPSLPSTRLDAPTRCDARGEPVAVLCEKIDYCHLTFERGWGTVSHQEPSVIFLATGAGSLAKEPVMAADQAATKLCANGCGFFGYVFLLVFFFLSCSWACTMHASSDPREA